MKKFEVIVVTSQGDYYPETVSSIISVCGDPNKVKSAINYIFTNLNNVYFILIICYQLSPVSNLSIVIPTDSLSTIIDTLSKLKKRLDYTLTTRYCIYYYYY